MRFPHIAIGFVFVLDMVILYFLPRRNMKINLTYFKLFTLYPVKTKNDEQKKQHNRTPEH
jgi:hypothetical protein